MQGPQQAHAALYQLLLQQRALPAAPSGQPSEQQHGHDAALLSMMQHAHMRAQLQAHLRAQQQAAQQEQPQQQQARPAQATAATLPAGTQQQAATALGPQQARLPQAAAAALAAGAQQHATQLAPAVPAVLPAGVQQQAAAAPGQQQVRPPQAAAAALAPGTHQHTTQEAHEGLRAGVALAVARGRLPLQPCGSWASGNTGPAAPTGSDDEDCDTMPTRKRARVV